MGVGEEENGLFGLLGRYDLLIVFVNTLEIKKLISFFYFRCYDQLDD